MLFYQDGGRLLQSINCFLFKNPFDLRAFYLILHFEVGHVVVTLTCCTSQGSLTWWQRLEINSHWKHLTVNQISLLNTSSEISDSDLSQAPFPHRHSCEVKLPSLFYSLRRSDSADLVFRGPSRSEYSQNPNSKVPWVCGERSLQCASSITDSRAETDSQPLAANTNSQGADCTHMKSSFEEPDERFPSRYCPAQSLCSHMSHHQGLKKQIRM